MRERKPGKEGVDSGAPENGVAKVFQIQENGNPMEKSLAHQAVLEDLNNISPENRPLQEAFVKVLDVIDNFGGLWKIFKGRLSGEHQDTILRSVKLSEETRAVLFWVKRREESGSQENPFFEYFKENLLGSMNLGLGTRTEEVLDHARNILNGHLESFGKILGEALKDGPD